MGTIAEKILSSKSGRHVSPGEIVVVPVDVALGQDGTTPLAIDVFREMGAKKVWDADKIVIVVDHIAPASTESTAENQKKIRAFVAEQGIRHFYDVGAGVCHQVLAESGLVHAGDVVVGADSHTTMHGALGAFSTGIGSTELASVFASGKIWFKVPQSMRVNLNGALRGGVYAKDVVLQLLADLRTDGARYKALEFSDNKTLCAADRMTVSNMSMEMGAKVAIFEGGIKPDAGAKYERVLEYDLRGIKPLVACPHSVDSVKPVAEVHARIDQAFIGSCTNGRIEDLRVAAGIMKGKKVKARTLVIPASDGIYARALAEGLLKTFVDAGCTVCNPGCGPCPGGHQGLLAAGEACIGTHNRNYKGRMGSADASIYLASPATVAHSAIAGEISSG
jgi:homoaconitate hydratase family protein